MKVVFECGDGFGGVTDALNGELGSPTSNNAPGLEGLPRMTMVDG